MMKFLLKWVGKKVLEERWVYTVLLGLFGTEMLFDLYQRKWSLAAARFVTCLAYGCCITLRHRIDSLVELNASILSMRRGCSEHVEIMGVHLTSGSCDTLTFNFSPVSLPVGDYVLCRKHKDSGFLPPACTTIA